MSDFSDKKNEDIEILDDDFENKRVVDINNLTPRISIEECVSGQEAKPDITLEESTSKENDVQIKSQFDVEKEKTYSFKAFFIDLIVGIFIAAAIYKSVDYLGFFIFFVYSIFVCGKIYNERKYFPLSSMFFSYIVSIVFAFLAWDVLDLLPFFNSSSFLDFSCIFFVISVEFGVLPYTIYSLVGWFRLQKIKKINEFFIIILGCIFHIVLIISSYFILQVFLIFDFLKFILDLLLIL